MDVIRLTGENCMKTRPLWEEVFSEDSKQFVDYYYMEKAQHNIGYVTGEEPYEAMLFRTPYPIQIYDKIRELSYIVGVATREEFRHKGKMTALMMTAMQDMYRRKHPFTFLMPADPAIYEPFGFSYVYERPQWSFRDSRFALEVLEPIMGTDKKIEFFFNADLQAAGAEWQHQLSAEKYGEWSNTTDRKQKTVQAQMAAGARQEELYIQSEKQASHRLSSLRGHCKAGEDQRRAFQRLADYANHWLSHRYQIYVKRDARYYERQLAELKAQNGDIFLLEKGNRLAGFFLYAREGNEIAVQEMMEDMPDSFSFLQEAEERKPVIMARILHLEEMMKLARSPQNQSVLIEVEDSLIPENEGLFLWEITPKGSSVTRLKEGRQAEISMTIEELAPRLIQGVFLNEIV